MEEKKANKIRDKIADLINEIIANSKDASWTKKALTRLISLQKQSDIEAVELIVPVKEVKETLDYGPYALKKTPRGILFIAKGGLYTFVESRMNGTYGMLNDIFEIQKDDTIDTELQEGYVSSVSSVMQAPIFASIDIGSMLGIASSIISEYSKFVNNKVENAELHEETEEDITANDDATIIGDIMKQAHFIPWPPEE